MLDRAAAALFAASLLTIVACSDDSSSDSTSGAVTTLVIATTTEAKPPDTTVAVVTTSATPGSTVAPASFDFSAAAAIVEDFVDERGLNGAALVIVDSEAGIVGEVYAGVFDAERVSLIASSSKMLAAGILLRLQDQGVLDLDAPIASYVPWGAGNPEITVAQLLSNSSGLVGLFPEPGFAPYVCQFVGAEIEQCAQDVFATEDDDAQVVPPDTEFRYGGVQWQVAGAVAEAVSGNTWEQLLDETYREPCGVESLGFNNHWVTLGTGGFDYPTAFDVSTLVPTENPHIEGGAYINPIDYATLLLMHLRDGECGNGRALSAEAVAQAHADRIGDVRDGSAGDGTGYGLGWWVDRDSGRISDSGAYGSVPWLDVGNGFGAYLVIEADSLTGNELAALLYEPVEAAVLSGRESTDY